MKLKYRNGGRPDMDVKSLLTALGEDDKRGLNKLLNKQNRIDLANDEQEGYDQIKLNRKKKQAERKRLNQEFFEEMRSDDPVEEEIEGEEGEGGIDKEKLMKYLKAIGAGGVGLGAMIGIPKLFNLLKKGKGPIQNNPQYHNILDPRPGPPPPHQFSINKLSGGRNE